MAHEINSKMKVGMMIAYTAAYALTCHPRDELKLMKDNQIRHFYCDVQCRGHYPQYKLKEYQIKLSAAPIYMNSHSSTVASDYYKKIGSCIKVVGI